MYNLKRKLISINGRGYKSYKSLKGVYNFGFFVLTFNHIQGDPFASPSKITVEVPLDKTGFPESLYRNRVREIAFRDAVSREVAKSIRRFVKGNRGSGKSGLVRINAGGQQVLERTSVVLKGGKIEVRMSVGLPAAGRRVLGREAEEMFFKEIPRVVEESLKWENVNRKAIESIVDTVEKAEFLRSKLAEMKAVAFVSNGAVLPRRSGVDDRPLQGAVPFKSPPELERTVKFPDGSEVSGMIIPEGVNLIVGGGFHGKSTLLNAIQFGFYNHIPGDGREFVVSRNDVVKVRAEDGRSVANVDISPFISDLPSGKDTSNFSTQNASGSTSQSSNIAEALEVGAKVLLLDEDTSATNFLVRDRRMQELIPKNKEPITPFLDIVRVLYTKFGVSTVFVVGGIGDYLDVADTVLMMDEYRTRDVTLKARKVSEKFREERIKEIDEINLKFKSRIPSADSFDPSRGKREVKIGVKGERFIHFGREVIDLTFVEQIVNINQVETIGDMIYALVDGGFIDGKTTLKNALDNFYSTLEKEGLDLISRRLRLDWKDHSFVRKFEVASAINRLRTLKCRFE